MKERKIIWFSFAKRFIPADYEIWLEKMSLEGWEIDKIGRWSSIITTFKRCTPTKYRYIYDVQVTPQQHYITTFKDFGWELTGQMGSCYLWRKEYADVRPESFTTKESLEIRNKQMFAGVSYSFFTFLAILLILGICFTVFYRDLNSTELLQYMLGFVFSGLLAVYLGYVMRKIYMNRFR